MWGAARHDRAEGVHRPLFVDVMTLAHRDGGPVHVRVQLDLVGLDRSGYERVAAAAAEGARTPVELVTVTFSHSHSAGFLTTDRVSLPGGELIPAYLDGLVETVRTTATASRRNLKPSILSYGFGRCSMAANRDYRDSDREIYCTGFNPDEAAPDLVTVARITDEAGKLRGTLLHYACHPTTLAWDNRLLSPDYIGAAREVVERATRMPCIFILGACGELGPVDGFVGDPAVADRNGRSLGYAGLSALESLPTPGVDREYAGPVVSGATIGTWRDAPHDADRFEATTSFRSVSQGCSLALRSLPTTAQFGQEILQWEAQEQESLAAGDAVGARDAGARAERARRWLGRVDRMQPALNKTGTHYSLLTAVWLMGDVFWVMCGGEPYHTLQESLSALFPDSPVLVSPLLGPMDAAYLLPSDRYGMGLYQEEPSALAQGCLEVLGTRLYSTMSALTGDA